MSATTAGRVLVVLVGAFLFVELVLVVIVGLATSRPAPDRAGRRRSKRSSSVPPD